MRRRQFSALALAVACLLLVQLRAEQGRLGYYRFPAIWHDTIVFTAEGEQVQMPSNALPTYLQDALELRTPPASNPTTRPATPGTVTPSPAPAPGTVAPGPATPAPGPASPAPSPASPAPGPASPAPGA